MKAGKIWGQTELIHANGVLEFHRIEYKAGYKCSEHEHEFKWNGFYVESGKMIVRVWQNDYDLVDETILLPGDFTQVKPGCVHQFEGLETGVAFELYWAEFNHNDIKRRSVGRSLSAHEYEDNPSEIEKDYEEDPLRKVINKVKPKKDHSVLGTGKMLSWNTSYNIEEPTQLHPWHDRWGMNPKER
tara:strand:- start:35 stop:592 length:558 start_codon:yes stop_codon:yes gene_type:complete